ncbi:unnamed protein product [Miscanthus lutarioriparius]|uniref:Uncharacterized protein n=1 Tax=Miscanthus lutarioriparius TaxID=422564 RepID=A0A811QBR4_9POAL|nr:unnamed protein product [Miscanthus lutarioriparius]
MESFPSDEDREAPMDTHPEASQQGKGKGKGKVKGMKGDNAPSPGLLVSEASRARRRPPEPGMAAPCRRAGAFWSREGQRGGGSRDGEGRRRRWGAPALERGGGENSGEERRRRGKPRLRRRLERKRGRADGDRRERDTDRYF